jgi:hypothetical protein
LFRELGKDDAEWVANGVEENSERVAGLKIGFAGTERQCEFFGAVEIVNREIQMQLLGDWPFGPRRRDETLYLLKSNRWLSFIEELNPVHVFWREPVQRLYCQSAKFGVKVGEHQRFGAIKCHHSVSHLCHGNNVTILDTCRTYSKRRSVAHFVS